MRLHIINSGWAQLGGFPADFRDLRWTHLRTCLRGLEGLRILHGISSSRRLVWAFYSMSHTLRLFSRSLKLYAKLHVLMCECRCVLRAQVFCFYQILKGVCVPKEIKKQRLWSSCTYFRKQSHLLALNLASSWLSLLLENRFEGLRRPVRHCSHPYQPQKTSNLRINKARKQWRSGMLEKQVRGRQGNSHFPLWRGCCCYSSFLVRKLKLRGRMWPA